MPSLNNGGTKESRDGTWEPIQPQALLTEQNAEPSKLSSTSDTAKSLKNGKNGAIISANMTPKWILHSLIFCLIEQLNGIQLGISEVWLETIWSISKYTTR